MRSCGDSALEKALVLQQCCLVGAPPLQRGKVACSHCAVEEVDAAWFARGQGRQDHLLDATPEDRQGWRRPGAPTRLWRLGRRDLARDPRQTPGGCDDEALGHQLVIDRRDGGT
jgi:hypothetical protein